MMEKAVLKCSVPSVYNGYMHGVFLAPEQPSKYSGIESTSHSCCLLRLCTV